MAKKKKKEKKLKSNQTLGAKDNTLTLTACRGLIWAGLFLALLVPLQVNLGFYFPFISYRSLWFMVTVQFTFTVWLFLAYHYQAYRPSLNLVTLTMVLLIFTMTLSTIFGADPAMSFWSKHERMTGLLMHLHLFAYFLVLSSFLRKEEEWRVILSIAVGIAVLVSIWGLADNNNYDLIINLFHGMGLVSEQVTDLSKAGSTLGNTSFMASYLLINAFFALYLLIKATNCLKIPYILALLIIILAIYLNPGGRAVQGSVLAGITILFLLYLAFVNRHHLIRLVGKAILGFSLLAAPVIGILSFIEGSRVRNLVMDQYGMPVRYATWGSALRSLTERPLFGWGPENFEIAFYKNYDPRVMLPHEYGYPAQPWHDRAHNVVIDTLAATGIIGALVFFALFVVAVVLLWRGYLKDKKYDFWAPGILTAMLAAHFIQNLTVFDMLSSYMLIFLALAFAGSWADQLQLGNKVGKYINIEKALKPLKVPAYLLSLTIFALLSLFVAISFKHFVYQPYQASIYVNRAMQTGHEGSLLELYPLAIKTSPLGRQHIRRDLTNAAVSRLQGADGPSLVQVHFPEIDYMLEELQIATEQSPLNYRNHYSLGQAGNAYVAILLPLSAEQEMIERAREVSILAGEAYRKALDINQAGIHAYHGLAQNLIYQGVLFSETEYFQESLELLETALVIEPRLLQTHQMLVQIATDLIGDQDLARQLTEDAVAINSTWESELLEHLEED